jgi:hypothetical protein
MENQKINSLVQTPLNESGNKNGELQLSPIKVDEKYLKEWNANMADFVVLTRNGQLISNSLYRVGLFKSDVKKDYFMIIKYVEDIYTLDFMKRCYPDKSKEELESRRKHLAGKWCIIDKNGAEKVVFKEFESPYLIDNSIIYTLDSKYYNVETGEFYCRAYKAIESSEFLFLENKYDEDPLKRGVMQINKKDGKWSLFK